MTDDKYKQDIEILHDNVGLFYGQLTDSERDAIDRCVKDGIAIIDYGGMAGLLGLGKIYINENHHDQ